jgi:hypothetical protein
MNPSSPPSSTQFAIFSLSRSSQVESISRPRQCSPARSIRWGSAPKLSAISQRWLSLFSSASPLLVPHALRGNLCWTLCVPSASSSRSAWEPLLDALRPLCWFLTLCVGTSAGRSASPLLVPHALRVDVDLRYIIADRQPGLSRRAISVGSIVPAASGAAWSPGVRPVPQPGWQCGWNRGC